MDKDYLISKINMLYFDIGNDEIDKLISYYEMVIEKNKVMNLTAITDQYEFIDKHIIDSIILGKFYDLNRPVSIIDVGTGAGFPGIPLKIVFPDIRIDLLDSLNKRIVFLNDVINELSLDGIRAFHGRAEEYARKAEFREQYDICVSRAVANMSSLSEYCIPFVKKKGIFAAYKSGESDEEINRSINAVNLLGGKIDHTEKYRLPGTDYDRTIVFIKKVNNTSGKYPRKAGLPSKEPL